MLEATEFHYISLLSSFFQPAKTASSSSRLSCWHIFFFFYINLFSTNFPNNNNIIVRQFAKLFWAAFFCLVSTLIALKFLHEKPERRQKRQFSHDSTTFLQQTQAWDLIELESKTNSWKFSIFFLLKSLPRHLSVYVCRSSKAFATSALFDAVSQQSRLWSRNLCN